MSKERVATGRSSRPSASKTAGQVTDMFSRTPGQPLDAATLTYFESRMGFDFSRVRIYADPHAQSAAESVDAEAFTAGSRIAFAPGRYSPGTPAGRLLLAHELTHVMQGRGGGAGRASRVSEPHDAAEREADRAAQRVLSGGPMLVLRETADALHLHRKKPAALPPIDQMGSAYDPKKSDPDVSGYIHFSTLETDLDEQDLQVIEAVVAEATTLAVFNEIDFFIDGFADSRPVAGDPKGNQTLALNRAVTTKTAMEEEVSRLPPGLPKKALERSMKTTRTPAETDLPATYEYQRRAEIRIFIKPTLEKQKLISWDPNTPELITVIGPGVTPRRLAVELYGDGALADKFWFSNWDETTHGKLTYDTMLPVSLRARLEYEHLRPRKKSLYDRTVTVKPRSSWGARPAITDDPKRDYTPYTGKLEDILDSIAVHHSGNSNMHTMKEVQDHHLDEKEAADINYHYGIDLLGNVYAGRPINVKGAHVAGANTGKIGIVLLADLDPGSFDLNDDDLTADMESSLLRLIHNLRGRYPNIKFLGGHLEFAAAQGDDRTCPGALTMAKMNGWRSSTELVKPPMK